MKKTFALQILTILAISVSAQTKVQWIATSQTEEWKTQKGLILSTSGKADLETLIPFIKKAQKYNPSLKLWASPWSPPTWMKYNKHYAGRSVLGNVNFKSEEFGMDLTGINNGLQPDKEGKEGEDMFIQEEK